MVLGCLNPFSGGTKGPLGLGQALHDFDVLGPVWGFSGVLVSEATSMNPSQPNGSWIHDKTSFTMKMSKKDTCLECNICIYLLTNICFKSTLIHFWRCCLSAFPGAFYWLQTSSEVHATKRVLPKNVMSEERFLVSCPCLLCCWGKFFFPVAGILVFEIPKTCWIFWLFC